jgi:CheY-like chemotaxis protein
LSASQSTTRSILLIEDEDNDFLLIKRVFEQTSPDWTILRVNGGLEAVAYLHGDPPYDDRTRHPLPTMVLLDIKMPLMDGFEVLRWIRHHPAPPRRITLGPPRSL